MTLSYSLPSRPTLEADLALARQNGDFAAEANCLISLGDIAKENEEYALAQGLYGQAWAAYDKAGDQCAVSRVILSLVSTIAITDFPTSAIQDRNLIQNLQRQALILCEQLGDKQAQAYVWEHIGYQFTVIISPTQRLDSQGQRQAYQSAYNLYEQVGDSIGQAKMLTKLIPKLRKKDDPACDTAEMMLKKALALYPEADSSQSKAQTLKAMANIKTIKEDYQAAVRLHREAHTYNAWLPDNRLYPFMVWDWGRAEYKAGFYEEGCRLCQQAYAAVELHEDIFYSYPIPQWRAELAAMNFPPTETSHDL